MAKKTYKDRDFKFETLQLHVGQESADPVTDARAVPIYRLYIILIICVDAYWKIIEYNATFIP